MENKDFRNHEVVENHDEGISRYYKITARNEGQLNMIEKIFAHMQYLGSVGSSRKFTVFCDGDGAVRLKFQSHKENEFVFQDLDYDEAMNKDSGYGRCEISDKDGMGEETYFDLG